jgi:hypothetical protein
MDTCMPTHYSKYLESLLKRTPDLYLHKLKKDLTISCSLEVGLSTILRMLKERGFTHKKLGITFGEQSKQAQEEYWAHIQQYNPDQLVFVDESSYDHRTGRHSYSWAPNGLRLRQQECFVRGT